MKTEAVVMMPETLAQNLLINSNGRIIDGCPMEVRRLSVCKLSGQIGGCKTKDCKSFHPGNSSESDNSGRFVRSNRSMCWHKFEDSCPFGKGCYYQHEEAVENKDRSGGGGRKN